MPHAVEEQLFVNDGPLGASQVARLEPCKLTLPLDELRRRYKENGYLYVKGLLPRKDVFKVREEYFKFMSPSGVLKEGTEPVAGIFDTDKAASNFPGIGVGRVAEGTDKAHDFLSLALEAHGQHWYAEEFCKHPALLEFISRFTGWGSRTRALERTLLRNNIPGAQAIGVHYDQIFLRHGEPTSVTVWIPMGDIRINGGGLMYLENGHVLGKAIEEQFTEKAKAAGLSDEEAKSAFNQNMTASGVLTDGAAEFGRIHNRRWLVSDYEAGDVVLHNPYMIHASTVNKDPANVIRLATDLRYVDTCRPWDERWTQTYRAGDGL